MKKLYSLLAAAVMAIAAPLSASAVTHYDPQIAHISSSGAPEGTAYVDILIKMPTDDADYVYFTQPPQRCGSGQTEGEPMPVTSESEIASYREDGYVSLSLHHKKAQPLKVYPDGEDDILTMNSTEQTSCDFIDLSIEYGTFKAAYVDENGGILGVTDASVTKYSTKTPYGFRAEGSSLIFQRHGAHPAVISAIFAITALLLISLPLILTFLYRRHSKRIKNGERNDADNGQKLVKEKKHG